MIPLAITQAEEVGAIRQWAALRAVGATGSEDLDAAEQQTEPAPPPGAVPAAASGQPARGGRTVDF
jgi:hypothetical protein